jgi:putative ABC transport system ATP-binding protein
MISIKKLNKSFSTNEQKFHALNDINLDIKEGECLVIKGISGSGKSTLLSIIGAIMKPTSGAIEVQGENIVSYSDFHASEYRNKEVGFISQSFHLFDELSVKENVALPLIISSISDEEANSLIDQAMQIANIAHKQNQKTSTLSGGEKQRCVIARALLNQPNIILCDEPTANLDGENTLKFIDILNKLKSMKKTLIIATHDPLIENASCVERVLRLKDGSLE